MFPTGLLILTQPLASLRAQIPFLLHRVSQVVSDTLYVHLQPVKGSHSNAKFLLNPVPVTSDFRNVVKDIYSIGSSVCRKVDIRVLLNHVSNTGIQADPYALQKGYSIVILDDTPSSKNILVNKGELLKEVKAKFFTASEIEIKVLENEGLSSSYSSTEDVLLETYKNVVLGGTFDRLHVGHKILLSEGCMLAEQKLTVGVSEGKMNEKKVLNELIQPLMARTSAVVDFIKEIKSSIIPDVVTIYDAFGPTVTDPDFQCIILSEETQKGGAMINTEREKRGMHSLKEVVIGLVEDKCHSVDEDEKISSSSLRKRILGTLIQKPISKPHLPTTPYRIGLTGGIASGKSAICRRLEGLGAGVIECDSLGHEAYKPGMPAFNRIKEHFGDDIVGTDGMIDRGKLGGIVFADKKKLKELNDIVWPEILRLAEEEIARLGQSGKKVVILDAAVLLEAGWDKSVHEVWSTFVPRAEAIKRIMDRNGLAEEDAVKRLDSQLSNSDRLSHANVILCTLWAYEYTQKQCERAWSLLQERLNTCTL